jgi:transcriptional regulator with XRE-family HTH domain
MTDKQASQLGRLLAHARRNRGLSLRAVAALADIAYPWLSRIERGDFNDPAPERLTRVIDALGIDPERVNRITHGHVSSSLPGIQTYFRAKFDLSPEEIEIIERTVREIQRKHEDQ